MPKHSLPPGIIEASWKAANEVFTEMSAKNAWFKRVYEHFVAFRGDRYHWNQVADHTMDTYMNHFHLLLGKPAALTIRGISSRLQRRLKGWAGGKN